MSDLQRMLLLLNMNGVHVSLLDEIKTQIDKTVKSTLAVVERPKDSSITSVPKATDLGFGQGKLIWATYLYTDMQGSSKLAALAKRHDAAQVFRAYLNVSTKIIRAHDGHIRSFDGDRVMGIFTGPGREDRAVQSALSIKWAVQKQLIPAIDAQYPYLKREGWTLRQASGIASGQSLLARAGFRNNDDMISIGVAPNLAAKLSDVRPSAADVEYETRSDIETFKALSAKCTKSAGNNMWQGPYSITVGGKAYSYHRSSYRWIVS